MNKKEFIKNLEILNINCTEDNMVLLDKYFNLLKDYNQHTNLTRIINEPDVYLKHFFDSLTICKVIDLDNEYSLLDYGSGAGFPGVVLKIFFPKLKVTLLDSNNKKTKFLEFLCSELKLDVTVINNRAENHIKTNINSYDVVIARAVANLRVLSEVSLPLVKASGYFIAMKGSSEIELKESLETIECMNSNIEKIEKFLLPIDNSQRSIILIKKIKDTKLTSLRTYDKILKNGLKKK